MDEKKQGLLSEKMKNTISNAITLGINAVDSLSSTELVNEEKSKVQKGDRDLLIKRFVSDIQNDSTPIKREKFGFYFNQKQEGPVRFVLHQPDKRFNKVLSSFIPSESTGIAVNTSEALSRAFGFKGHRDYIMRSITFSDPKRVKQYREFHQNVISSSTELKHYRSEAEYANAMLQHITKSPVWDDPDFASKRREFNLEPRLAQCIQDFCHLGGMRDRLSTWKTDDYQRDIGKNTRARIDALLEQNTQEWKYRVLYLKSLETIFEEFLKLEKQFQRNADFLSMEEELSNFEGHMTDLESMRDQMLADVQELSYVGMNIQASRIALNSSLEEMLDALESTSATKSPFELEVEKNKLSK